MARSRSKAAAYIGNVIGDLEDEMNHLAKGEYDPDAHNPCFSYVELADGSTRLLFAYSDSSKMNKALKEYYEIPPSAAYGDHFGLTMMQKAHTEPKLLNFIMNSFPSVGPTSVT